MFWGYLLMESGDIQKLNDLIHQVSDDKKPIAEQLLKELVFMSGTLENLKATIREKGKLTFSNRASKSF